MSFQVQECSNEQDFFEANNQTCGVRTHTMFDEKQQRVSKVSVGVVIQLQRHLLYGKKGKEVRISQSQNKSSFGILLNLQTINIHNDLW